LPLLLDALQAPFQKINLQRLLTDLAFQLRHTIRLRPAPPRSRKRLPWLVSKFLSPTVQ
jgi:hypothetical protein